MANGICLSGRKDDAIGFVLKIVVCFNNSGQSVPGLQTEERCFLPGQ